MQTNPNLILLNRLTHDQLNNLKPGDLITIDGKSGYSGYPMRFEYIIGPFVYLTVDTFNNGKFDYKSHYRIADYDFYWTGSESKKESQKSPKLERSGILVKGATKTFRDIFEKLDNGCVVVEYQPDDSLESVVTIAQLLTNLPTIGIEVVQVNPHLYCIFNPFHEDYGVVK